MLEEDDVNVLNFDKNRKVALIDSEIIDPEHLTGLLTIRCNQCEKNSYILLDIPENCEQCGNDLFQIKFPNEDVFQDIEEDHIEIINEHFDQEIFPQLLDACYAGMGMGALIRTILDHSWESFKVCLSQPLEYEKGFKELATQFLSYQGISFGMRGVYRCALVAFSFYYLQYMGSDVEIRNLELYELEDFIDEKIQKDFHIDEIPDSASVDYDFILKALAMEFRSGVYQETLSHAIYTVIVFIMYIQAREDA